PYNLNWLIPAEGEATKWGSHFLYSVGSESSEFMAASSISAIPISQLGEQELIRRFFTSSSKSNKRTVLGIGDDCAVLEADSEHYQLISTDQLLEETHFLQSLSSAGDIGHKAVAVNFSDIAAMGGQPTGIVLSLGLPPSTTN